MALLTKKRDTTKKEKKPKKRKSVTREWIDAIVFAVIAASIIRGFVVEAYTIPTSSMEKSLLTGDFLFVSKMHYGARLPMTPLAVPLVHNTLPLFGGNSYLTWIHLPYERLPGFTSIKNFDVVVFNYPMDTSRPVDKKENYIKRCIGIPGDTIFIHNGIVYVNGKQAPHFPKQQGEYVVNTDGEEINNQVLRDLDVTEGGQYGQPGKLDFLLTDSAMHALQKLKIVKSIDPVILPENTYTDEIFPQDAKDFPWNVDNFGPIVIPKKGVTVQLNTDNIALYRNVITLYEHHTLDVTKDGKIMIDGKEASEYTFAMNYYWMMGDNRHNSLDSRYWGYVPEDHIVGKAWFVWMSWDSNGTFADKIRWNRLFTAIN